MLLSVLAENNPLLSGVKMRASTQPLCPCNMEGGLFCAFRLKSWIPDVVVPQASHLPFGLTARLLLMKLLSISVRYDLVLPFRSQRRIFPSPPELKNVLVPGRKA